MLGVVVIKLRLLLLLKLKKMSNPQVNGKAVWSWPGEGSHMEGSFKRGYAHGPGVLYFSDGSRYGIRMVFNDIYAIMEIGYCCWRDNTRWEI